MAENLIDRARRWASRLTHYIYLGDQTKAAEWKSFALKKKNQLLDIGNGAPLAHHIEPNGDTKISYRTNGLVDTIIIEIDSSKHSLIIESSLSGAPFSEKAQLRTTKEKLPYKIKHIKKAEGGNIDWIKKKKTGEIAELLSWHGPRVRNGVGAFRRYTYSSITVFGQNSLLIHESGFGANVYKDGKLYAKAPDNSLVLGAALASQYLVIAAGHGLLGETSDFSDNHNKISILYTEKSTLKTDGSMPVWQTAGSFSLPTVDDEFAPVGPSHIVAFSESGTKFATIWSYLRKNNTYEAFGVVVQGSLSVSENGVSCSFDAGSLSSTGIANSSSSYDVVYPVGGLPFPEENLYGSDSSVSSTDTQYTAVLSVDFKGETLIKLNASHHSDANSSAGTTNSLVRSGWITIGEGSNSKMVTYVTVQDSTYQDHTTSFSYSVTSSDSKISLSFSGSSSSGSYANTDFAGFSQLGAGANGLGWMGVDTTGIDTSAYELRDELDEGSYSYQSSTELDSILFCDLRFDLIVYATRSQVNSAYTQVAILDGAGNELYKRDINNP